ncbi:MAG: hypothetical protein ACR2G7_14020, partial [Acidimicrobiales bacterium]
MPGIGTIAYEGHGNTANIWGETRSYDAADRHLGTGNGSTTVAYVRDSTDRIIQRTSTVLPAAPEVERYGFTGDGDSPISSWTPPVPPSNETFCLPGGVSVIIAATGQTWSYPNIHGDVTVTVTADAAGTKQGMTGYGAGRLAQVAEYASYSRSRFRGFAHGLFRR